MSSEVSTFPELSRLKNIFSLSIAVFKTLLEICDRVFWQKNI